MTDNLVLEHLKKIQSELSDSRQREQEILTRLSGIESAIARITRDEASNFSEIISDRHIVDQLKTRIDRIEKRLEIME